MAENSTDFVDKSYILKELGDRLAPAGRIHSKSLYLSGYRFLSDERNIDMIVKFFDIEVDNEGKGFKFIFIPSFLVKVCIFKIVRLR